ncbi:MAG: UbiA family prenyltransferase, partial [Chloroflexi bacterium]|nr:UbiA family prenyltransferase [Chloroflexota bacterium]
TGSLLRPADLPAFLLTAIVTLWIGGFDILYAMQDIDVDKRDGLHSIPARFGVGTGLTVARLCHLFSVALLVAVGLLTGLGWPYWLGVVVAAALFIYEHRLISPTDLSKLDLAFFNVNGYISVTIFVATLAALLLS